MANEGIKATKKGLIKPDKKVLIQADNLTGIKALRARPKY
jgi:hypothetical protein